MKRAILISTIFLLLITLGVLFLFKEEFFSSILLNLVRGDELKKADLIVALGGETFRKTEAKRLFKEGYAKKILFTGFDIEKDDYKRYGFKEGEYIYPVKSAFNTYEEALVVKEVAIKHNFKRVIVVTAFYHSRRAAYIFKKILGKEGIEVIIHPVFYKNLDLTDWWKNRYLLKVVTLEWLGLLYYHLDY